MAPPDTPLGRYALLIEWAPQQQQYIVTAPEWRTAGFGARAAGGATRTEAVQQGERLLDELASFANRQGGLNWPDPQLYADVPISTAVIEPPAHKRIPCDISNALTEGPGAGVLLALASPQEVATGRIPLLADYERVILEEPGLEVEAVVFRDSRGWWMAAPDSQTYRHLSELEAGTSDSWAVPQHTP